MERGNINGGATKGSPKKSKDGSFYRRMKAMSPVPYLAKAHDYYVRSLNKLAAKASDSGLDAGGLCVLAPMTTLPKGFSTTSSRNDHEYGELVRAASQRRTSSGSLYRSVSVQQPPLPRNMSVTAAPSVGKIDEDGPCYFPETFSTVSVADSRYAPRARSSTTPANNLHIHRNIGV